MTYKDRLVRGYVVFGLDYRGACQEGREKETKLTYRSALSITMIEAAIEQGGSSSYLMILTFKLLTSILGFWV